MTVKNLVENVTRGAVTGALSAVRHPISTTARAVGLVKGAAEAGIGLVHGAGDATETPSAAPEHEQAVQQAAERADEQEAPVPKQRAKAAPPEEPASDLGPDAANLPPMREPLPAAPQRTPEEMAAGSLEEFFTEPTAESRDSGHGGPPGGREEVTDFVEEIPVEPEVDVETPVGTTGASAGMNPDTAEADLQQPDTAPLVDPAVAKAVASEAETLQKAADPDKG